MWTVAVYQKCIHSFSLWVKCASYFSCMSAYPSRICKTLWFPKSNEYVFGCRTWASLEHAEIRDEKLTHFSLGCLSNFDTSYISTDCGHSRKYNLHVRSKIQCRSKILRWQWELRICRLKRWFVFISNRKFVIINII